MVLARCGWSAKVEGMSLKLEVCAENQNSLTLTSFGSCAG